MPHCLRLFAEVLGEVAASEFFVAIGCLEQRFAADVTARVVLVEKDDAEIAIGERTPDLKLVVLRCLHDEVAAQDLCGGG